MSNNTATKPKLQPEKQSVPGTSTDLTRTISYWFLAIVGLIYASGFLVVLIHLGTYGVTDVGGELLKARDIHIGVLAFVFPVTIMGTAFSMLFLPLIYLVTSRGREGGGQMVAPPCTSVDYRRHCLVVGAGVLLLRNAPQTGEGAP